MTEIIPGIYQIEVPIPNNPMGYTNLYLVQGDNGYRLIDAGWNDEAALQSLERQLTQIGLAFKDISEIIVTHSHPDHYGLAGRLRQLSQAKIAIHYLEKNLRDSIDMNTSEFLNQMEQWLSSYGLPPDALPMSPPMPTGMMGRRAPILPDITLRGGETFPARTFSLQVVWTPGHSPGHICLYEPNQKILFTGDHVLPVTTPNISLLPQSSGNPLADFLDSLNRVKQLEVNLVLPAHGHFFTDLPKRVDEIIEHHERRSLEILATIKAKPKTAYQISTEITWMPTMGGVSFGDLAHWNKRAAMSETLAHLEAMRVEDRVAQSPQDSIIYYQPARFRITKEVPEW